MRGISLMPTVLENDLKARFLLKHGSLWSTDDSASFVEEVNKEDRIRYTR